MAKTYWTAKTESAYRLSLIVTVNRIGEILNKTSPGWAPTTALEADFRITTNICRLELSEILIEAKDCGCSVRCALASAIRRGRSVARVLANRRLPQ